jgi:antitoxin component of RelBE/YafQ-DinJ toxin-antitoxin module
MGNENKKIMIRIDDKLKRDFHKFCKSKGFTMSKAIQIFAYYCLENKVAPYTIADTNKYIEDGKEIRISFTIDIELQKKFAEVCGKYDMPMSVFLRNFIKECVIKNKFPFDKK